MSQECAYQELWFKLLTLGVSLFVLHLPKGTVNIGRAVYTVAFNVNVRTWLGTQAEIVL